MYIVHRKIQEYRYMHRNVKENKILNILNVGDYLQLLHRDPMINRIVIEKYSTKELSLCHKL